MPGPPTFHGYGYEAWAGGPGSGFARHSWSQPHTSNMHPGLTSVSQFGSTQSAGSVRRVGDGPLPASPGYGFTSSLKPPGWRGGSPGGAFGAFAEDVRGDMKNRQEAFQSAHSPSEGPEGLPPPGQVAAQSLHTGTPVQPGPVKPTMNWTPSTTGLGDDDSTATTAQQGFGAVTATASRSRRKAFNPDQMSLF